MKIALVVVGKTDAVYFIEALNEYKKRLQHYISFEMVEIPDVKNVKNLTAPQQKEKEAEPILKSLQPGDYIVLLDEKGKQYSSMEFAAYLERKMCSIPKRLVFVIGGPYGFAERIYALAAEKSVCCPDVGMCLVPELSRPLVPPGSYMGRDYYVFALRHIVV